MNLARQNGKNLIPEFFRYVFQNIAGMIGVSFYILADTFFISKAAGTNGLTALNLALPIYGILYAIGGMIGVGSATRHSILKAQGRTDIDGYFSNGIMWSVICSIPFILIGLISPGSVVQWMGGSRDIVLLATPYFRLFLIFSPFFMCHYIVSGFVRNDGNPTIAMVGSLAGSLFNVVFDYVFMFCFGMGLTGAALATVMSPGVCILVNSTHFLTKRNTVRFVWHLPDFRMLKNSVNLGVSAMVGELAPAMTTMVFNFMLLSLVGNTAVAAYGVVANYALIATAIYNGVSQGAQPLLSRAYGKRDTESLKLFFRLSVLVSFAIAVVLLIISQMIPELLVAVFNSSRDQVMAEYAVDAVRMYFPGYLFAGVNIILIGYFSATDKPALAFSASVLRGVVVISICAVILGNLMGVQGVWISFITAEAVTLILILFMMSCKKILQVRKLWSRRL